jgi:hypothetical protein
VKKQELDGLKVSIYKKLRRAIKSGENKKALEILDEIDSNREKYREVFLTWIDILLTYGADKLGEKMVYETDRLFGERVVFPTLFAGALGDVSADDKLRKRAYVWTSVHGIDIDEIKEDEEKFILNFKCPTGGSVSTKKDSGKTREAHAWSYGQKGLSYYCTHCPVAIEMMPVEKFGSPAWVCLPQSEGRCLQYIYKDPKNVPEKYYKRIGMKKK